MIVSIYHSLITFSKKCCSFGWLSLFNTSVLVLIFTPPIEFYAKQGYVKEGKTVADLAKTIKVPKDNLEKAVANWNKAVESKQDSEFNRTTAIEHTLSTPNYYAFQTFH